ncbi:GNAT family N-acetyltransferase [Rhodococcus pyridinivorans]|nr:GNAT family N-acetyltransferase [Rhodococcus pyridinivorans]
MKITVVQPSEFGPSELDRWRSMQRSTPSFANPFLSPEFTIAVGRLRHQARVAVLFDGKDIVGFFPFERRGLGYGVPIGAWHSDCQGMVHEVGLEWDPQELMRACGLAIWEFNHLVDGQRSFEPYEILRFESPIMDLSKGFDPFFAKLRENSSRFRAISRKQRKLSREIGDLRFVFDACDGESLRKVMEWKSAQYIRMGWPDRFARPWIVELLKDLLDTRTEGFCGIVSMLYAGDEPVAGHFGLRSDHVMAHWFPAYNTRFSSYSPGLIMHLKLAEGASAASVQHIDMGPGPEAYKQWFRSRDLTVAKGRIVRRSPTGALHWVRRVSSERVHEVVSGHQSLYRAAQWVRTGCAHVSTSLRRDGHSGSEPKFRAVARG